MPTRPPSKIFSRFLSRTLLLALSGPGLLHSLASHAEAAEVPVEPASPAALWAFGLLFVGFCAWIVLAMMKSNKGAAEQKTEDK
jgi:hypothetical protein